MNIPVFQIKFNGRKDLYEIDGTELHSGDTLTVLLFGMWDIAPKWVKTTLLYDEESYRWYLKDAEDYDISGLFAKAVSEVR